MTESELLSVVLETAALFGWRTAHFRPAMTTHGWRTAVSGDGKGFPDLVLVRGHRLLAIELEVGPRHRDRRPGRLARGAPSSGQRPRLAAAGNWADGTIEAVLRQVA